jgi:hypothetical protein
MASVSHPRSHHPELRTRRNCGSIEELLAGAARRAPFESSDGKSGSTFEQVEIHGERYVLKRLHVDDDWIARSVGDLRCRALLVWTSGLLDLVPPAIDHAVVGAASGLDRNGWGAALLMRDVGDHLVPPGDDQVALHQHADFLDHMAYLAARFWGWADDIGLLPLSIRWSFCGPDMVEVERERGWSHPVPRLVAEGWERFATRVPPAVHDLVTGLRRAPWALAEAARATPWTLLHGDWKMGNLGSWPDGSTILLDWAYPGEGPVCHDLAWYLAVNRMRLPETKEQAIARFRRSLEKYGVATDDWWERQLGLCLLGALVQFGWEKALGDATELDWWVDAARDGARWM